MNLLYERSEHMIEKAYPVSFEIEGYSAMFVRPDTGSSPVSYPAPTKSSLKSIFECVAMSKEAYFEPQRVEICAPIIFHKYSTNYCGPLKKSGTSNFQLFATVLEDVCYKVYGVILSYETPRSGSNPQHELQEVFLRRLSVGQFYTTPFLGWKEFTPTYFGPLRDTTVADSSINMTITSMLTTMYDRPTDGKVLPHFSQNVRIEKGVMFYAE
jgi:CRISPR-associated protein Cas5d